MKLCPVQGKISYATRAEAVRAVQNMQHRPNGKRKGAGVYACKACGGHHAAGHKFDRARQDRRLLAQRGVHA